MISEQMPEVRIHVVHALHPAAVPLGDLVENLPEPARESIATITRHDVYEQLGTAVIRAHRGVFALL